MFGVFRIKCVNWIGDVIASLRDLGRLQAIEGLQKGESDEAW